MSDLPSKEEGPEEPKPKQRGALWLAAKRKDPELVHAILAIPGAQLDLNETGEFGEGSILKFLLAGSFWEHGSFATSRSANEKAQALKESEELERCAVACVAAGADPFFRKKKSWIGKEPSAIAEGFERGRVIFLEELGKKFGKAKLLEALLEEMPSAPMLAALDKTRGGKKIELLLNWGLDPKSPEAADWLASCASVEACQALLSAGADPAGKGSGGTTPLEEIVRNPREKGSQIMALIAAEAAKAREAKASGGFVAVDRKILDGALSAIGEGKLQDARRIAKAGGASLADAKDQTGRSALMKALSEGRCKIALKLLEEKADPMETDSDGVPAFAYLFLAPYAEKPAEKKERKEMLQKARDSGWLSWRGKRGESALEALIQSDEALRWAKRKNISTAHLEVLVREGSRPDSDMERGLLGLLRDRGGRLLEMAVALRGDPTRERMALDAKGNVALASALAEGASLQEPASTSSYYSTSWSSKLDAYDFEKMLGKPEEALESWGQARSADGASFALEFARVCIRKLSDCESASGSALGQMKLSVEELSKRGLLGQGAWDPAHGAEGAEQGEGESSLSEALAKIAALLSKKARIGYSRGKGTLEELAIFADAAKSGGAVAEAAYWAHLLEFSAGSGAGLPPDLIEHIAMNCIRAAPTWPARLGPLGCGGDRAAAFSAYAPDVAMELDRAGLKAAANLASQAGKGPRGM